jgi:hypothetical protein
MYVFRAISKLYYEHSIINFTVEMTINYLYGMPGKGALTTPSADLKIILLLYVSASFL